MSLFERFFGRNAAKDGNLSSVSAPPRPVVKPGNVSLPDLTKGQQSAFDSILAGNSVFLSGSAGTGKSYVVSRVLDVKQEGTIACTPTARAALVIQGTTIHSAFQLSPAPIVNPSALQIPDTIRACDMVLIDEISMVRRDVFDGISSILMRENAQRVAGANPEHPNPIQLVCVGDFCQLSPVYDKGQEAALAEHYGVSSEVLNRNLFAFQSEYWDRWGFDNHYLTQVVRQDDKEFVSALDRARVGDPSCIDWFNAHSSDMCSPDAVIIEGRNRDVDALNDAELAKLRGASRTYYGVAEGETFQPYPAPANLRLKVGARVMVTFNTGYFVNGELGTVERLKDNSVVFRSDDGRTGEITSNTWTYRRYGVTKRGGVDRLTGETIGTYTQLPLRLGWAVSIHKSQGQTYDATEVDPATWDAGMLYVALSRVRRIDKMHLTKKINRYWLMASKEVVGFYSTIPGTPRYEGEIFSGFSHTKPAKDFKAKDPDAINPDNPLYGKGVVFTGDFDDGSSRDDLRQLVVDFGGKPQAKVSGRTDYVVQGNSDYAAERETGKIRKARENVAFGKRDTKVISEAEWHVLVDPWIGRAPESRPKEELQAAAADPTRPKVNPKSASEKATRSDSSQGGQTGRKSPHVWTAEDEAYLLAHADMTARELGEVFGVSAKAIEHKRAKLRKQ